MPNLDSLEKSLQTAKDTSKLFALADLAWYYHNIKPTKGILFAKEGLKLAQEKGLLNFQTEFTSTLGANYLVLGNYDKAKDYYFAAARLADKLHDSLSKAIYYSNIGKIYKNKNLYDSALYYFKKSDDIFIKSKHQNLIGSSLSNIASIYEAQLRYDKAEEFYRKALQIKINTQDSVGMSMIFNNIALILQKKGNWNKAIDYLNKSVQISRAIGDSNGVITSCSNLGLNYIYKKDYKRALKTFKGLLAYARLTEDAKLVSNINNYIGNSYYYLKNYDSALVYIRKSLAISEPLSILETMEESYQLLQKIYEAKQDYKSAYEYANKFIIVHDSLFNKNLEKNLASEIARASSELNVKLQVEKKNNKINKLMAEQKIQNNYLIFLIIIIVVLVAASIIVLILQRTIVKKNKFLEETNEQLRIKDKELMETIAIKDKFFRIISHDLKTPISIFFQLSNYLKDNRKNITKEETEQFLDDIRNTAINLNELIDNLSLLSKIQTGSLVMHVETINLALPVQRVINDFSKDLESKKINLSADLPENILIKADINMLFIIIKNFIENAVKFTEEGGEIRVKVFSKGDKAVFEVADTGVGISEDRQKKLFSYEKDYTYGTRRETGAGIGLLITKGLVELGNNIIEFESKENEGSTFRVIFNLIQED